METKVEVYHAHEHENGGYWVSVFVNVGHYYKHLKQSKVYCADREAVSEAVWNALNNKVCPECGHVFSDYGWEGIDTHWRAHHEDIMSYENAWELIRNDKYVEVMLGSAE
jgi:hypothetical protein